MGAENPLDETKKLANQVEASLVLPIEVMIAFQAIQTMLDENSSIRRQPVRFERMQYAFSGRETDLITLNELALYFADTGDPDRQAVNAVHMMNTLLEKTGSNLRLERVTTYRLKRRSKGME